MWFLNLLQHFEKELLIRTVRGLDAGFDAVESVIDEGFVFFQQRGDRRTGEAGGRVGVYMEIFLFPFREGFPKTGHDLPVARVQRILYLCLDGAVAAMETARQHP